MRRLWYVLGLIALALGIVGIALPVLPTVPFLLLAAAAFARSSPRLERRILDHPTYGPPVRAWRERGAISRLAKIWATLAMAGGVGFSLIAGMPIWVVTMQAMICTAIAAFVITRPEA
ncbi:Inner membrane protein YbaN [Paracoccus haematequi]|uniref:Inner membrane protein YbaN n=1 Tax=Paracoccus haematequi TaxID=2491866 RepID=A0A447IJS5_9RHOB|nr:YbaN family protein [Paracoccus haematequi]VDS07743.1 Inner membrane protein YbaN [Paracoccus haematequi]